MSISIYKASHTNNNQIISDINIIRKELREEMQRKIKASFARKVMLGLDYGMVFLSSGVDFNSLFMDVLTHTISDFKEKSQTLYPSVDLYWFINDVDLIIIISNINEHQKLTVSFHSGWVLIEDQPSIDPLKLDKIKQRGFIAEIFNINMVDFYTDWLDYLPNIDSRCSDLVEHIILNKNLSKQNMSILKKIDYIEEIKGSKMYQNLYNKIRSSLPKLEKELLIKNKIK